MIICSPLRYISHQFVILEGGSFKRSLGPPLFLPPDWSSEREYTRVGQPILTEFQGKNLGQPMAILKEQDSNFHRYHPYQSCLLVGDLCHFYGQSFCSTNLVIPQLSNFTYFYLKMLFSLTSSLFSICFSTIFFFNKNNTGKGYGGRRFHKDELYIRVQYKRHLCIKLDQRIPSLVCLRAVNYTEYRCQ